MVHVTQEDKDRATEAIERIDAAPAEPGGEPEVTSSTVTAHGIIAEVVAGAREDASQGEPADCSALEATLKSCQNAAADYKADLASCTEANTALRAEKEAIREAHKQTVNDLKAQLRRCMAEDENDDELLAQIAKLEAELAKVTEYANYAQPRVGIFNHMAQGLVATLQIIEQDKAINASREAQEAAQADVVADVAKEAKE